MIVVVTTSQVASEFDTAASRQLMAAQLMALPPIFQGMLGAPVGIEHLGGFISWRALNFIPVLYGIWAIVALAGTLAGELAGGSLDVVASTPLARRRLAIEKVLAYLVLLGVSVVIIGISVFVATNVFATLPGDAVPAGSVAGSMLLMFLMILAPGAVGVRGRALPRVGEGRSGPGPSSSSRASSWRPMRIPCRPSTPSGWPPTST